ncbi:hypothetical protein FRB93_013563 [Tulasnella sp. JGI-2019a]|nr:hypothetical protein FRB93_013563 [Tulasnella sp. JGI-2019a]
MMWRCYVIWSRNLRVLIFPVILMAICVAGCGVIIYYDIAAQTRLAEPNFQSQLYAMTITVFFTTIAMTWYTTGFICYRLWSSERQTRAIEDHEVNLRSGPYGKIIKALVQSRMLYSLTEAFFCACVMARNINGMTIVAAIDGRIIGIVTTLIVLQLHNGVDSPTVITYPRSRITGNGNYSVRVTQHTDIRGDVEMKAAIPDDPIKSQDDWA